MRFNPSPAEREGGGGGGGGAQYGHFIPREKTKGLLVLSRGIKWEYLSEMT